jgi:short-subunit dehydrogenase
MPKALITGASTGIGLELTKIFAHNGYELILVSRNLEKLQEVAASLQTKTTCISKDLSNIDQVKELANQVSDIDVLVNNAGFGDYGELINLDPEKQVEMINLNVSALTYLSQIYAKRMASKRSGRILNIASVASFLPGPLMATYYATKAYVLSFSYALAEELRPYKVQVSVCCPGPTDSNFGQRAGAKHSSAFRMPMSSSKVAQITYRKLMHGEGLIVTGKRNRLLTLIASILPKKISAKINYQVLK